MLIRYTKFILITLLFALSTSIFTGCTTSSTRDDKTLTVSILPIKYLVDRIAGDTYSVNLMVPPGSSPETYEPTMQQMKSTSNSLIYFAIGNIEFENAFAAKLRETAPDVTFVDLSASANLIEGTCGHNHAVGAHAHGKDPHTWMSPSEMQRMATTIYNQIAEIDPENAPKFAENLAALTRDIDSLDLYITHKLKDLPSRTVIINHPALGYYARDYGLTQIAIEEEGKEPSTQHLKRVVDIARDQGIKSILYQSQFGAWSVEAVVKEIGGQSVPVDPLSGDWLENMYTITNVIADEHSGN